MHTPNPFFVGILEGRGGREEKTKLKNNYKQGTMKTFVS